MQIKQRILAVLAFGIFAFTSQVVTAEVKIAVVDVQRAILNSEQAKTLLGQIQEEAAALLERLQKDADVMSEAEKRRIQQEIESYNNDFQYERQKLQKAINTRQTELFSGTEAKIQQAIEDLVRKNDYDLILPTGAALYAGDLYDITRKVTEMLNEQENTPAQ